MEAITPDAIQHISANKICKEMHSRKISDDLQLDRVLVRHAA